MSELMVGARDHFLNGYGKAMSDVKTLIHLAKQYCKEIHKDSPHTLQVYDDAFTYIERKIEKLYTGDNKNERAN